MAETLLTVPNYAPASGSLPVMPDAGYLGYFDSGSRQLVFVYRLVSRSASVFISTHGWEKACATMHRSRLPQDIVFSGDEAQWLRSCWSAAMRRLGCPSLENILEANLFGTTPLC